MFSSRLDLAERYADILATDGVVRGLIGPREVPRIWDRHIMNSAVVVPRIPAGATVADIGTGAGLPGLVWAIARPDLTVTLVEPLLRRTTFLEEAVTSLGLDNVRVLRSRAEDVHETFDVVTARAVAALDKLGRWCMPLVSPGGVLLALKGRSAADEIEAATPTLRRLGATSIVVATYENGDVPTTVVEVTK
ncbi:16S rRNA (guanine(527)-N(7))-methyltransferase RsmG [Aeromicrobium wangtongii]|uniref:Ribosomal RNA small subunit methyltransferase G n=1 Tax=Aeromicrobium wangtongii TaxID=2969247 RepID=A0ABY5M6D4_9ACTN|nr:16S rRNA (guanine(527)-N(7))-methyltransferase RsmG [Aeromicrobium wangtongii]MCD9199373.1 16S rRNA (guanine(527)-N(7))-methyltransferase RsmG [Aeromicrobium wangtongii]UUP13730.1 16S rRNA (guanine(527)-N(7))-methyltransferase RsmG [Aeromicrobium wangtongii]